MNLEHFIAKYNELANERKSQAIPPLALDVSQTTSAIEILNSSKFSDGDKDFCKDLLVNRVNPGVDDSAKIKAEFLGKIAKGEIKCDKFAPQEAVKYLGTMLGGYNVPYLLESLSSSNDEVAAEAVRALKHTLLVYDAFEKIADMSKDSKDSKVASRAKEIIESWANAEWFLAKKELPKEIKLAVLKIDGETNTDDLSPASDAFTRSDIPLHAKAMLKSRVDNYESRLDSIKKIAAQNDAHVVYVGDVVGTGSSRKSACNSIVWHFGDSIPYIPNKKSGGFVIGSIIAPIFFATCEDSGCLPVVANVDKLKEGDIIILKPHDGQIVKNGEVVSTFTLSPNTIFDEIRAGGRIPLIIGRGLTNKARKFLGLGESEIFAKPKQPAQSNKGYTLAQKMVGVACGKEGVRAGEYCEPKATTVGSQDTTGAMTRDEVKELASLSYSADFVMQSFCHTAAYPKPADISLQATLPNFMTTRGGVALRPKDGVIHSWLNRFCLPDTVGTGGDSHTRFPIGISFPAGSGLVAFAAVTGSMPLNMPESVLVRFKGKMNPGITLRDLVNAIPYYAIKKGLLTVPKQNKKNIFSGKVLEIEGLEDIKVEQAFELSDASAERSAAACTIALNKEPIIEYLESNIALIEAMIKDGYQNAETLARRAKRMREWINNPVLLKADKDAEYAAVIEIDLSEIKEPILACPNDPDDVATLGEILADSKRPKHIDEVFIGSCMTNIGHFRAFGEIMKNEGQSATRTWLVPPTKMDSKKLSDEGYFSLFGAAGARIEVPGCSLCMGNQARVKDNAVVFSTSTRNFDNRMGKGAQVYLGSAELGAVCAKLGRLPSVEEYLQIVPQKLGENTSKVYRYLEFDKIKDFAL
ncbi:bifunctional aconitate hydratase 2/2-methylisocitrate dehydratase [Helicobacter saguini]|uniref:Aconitate hydratase B n=1 Tax=Helicobacter saguini TaxID=1548018 RepID=A0A347VSM7_9HELI|nr:bifunctional aconitate hydratase 2/2-methylisocitrate dehydratase [Helicobacter saguini]MWV62436.1 bifunctional aconitate hydratase 2/2-methylisocitrate dehydratase [Helicobacter saguini]MWV66892.1 bifunctional aconitate hydratase 2/2-methylisocitrate dehydratase [Helicobacter saguini]MWV69240.1 bifunctional aconitate hydratase 2/2-methylisocitrate dehydratase [Helicobacter saguini]MWV71204.1 bifunctional aconitate hydratase 2/2-methylisocitrate dehydratase [Helicobacter saguini]TLD93347.1 